MIEQIFGVLKQHFQILQLPTDYGLDIQSCLPAALTCIHNFILAHNPTASADNNAQVEGHDGPALDEEEPAGHEGENLGEDAGGCGEASIMHDRITQEMWDDYQQVLQSCQDADDEDWSLSDE